MFSLRFLRKAASPVVVAGASCAVAMLALTGCGDDDGPKAPPPMPSLDMPSLKPLLPSGPGAVASGPPSGSDAPQSAQSPKSNAAAGGPASTGASKASTSPPRIKVAVGDCVEIDDTGNLMKVSCTVPHFGQVGAVFTLPESTDPSAPTYKDSVNAKCDELLKPMLRRQDNPMLYALVAYHPSVRSWTEENDRDLGCIMRRADNGNIVGALK